MAKIKLTKNELKKHKDSLKRFNRYLPTLLLKKQQLQTVIRKVEQEVIEKQEKRKDFSNEIHKWIGVFGQEQELESLIKIKELRMSSGNIAGIDIPVFEGLDFEEIEYDLFKTPLWVDKALEKVKGLLYLQSELFVLEEELRLLADELRITTQRVNLFEKVKIPEAKESIRKILVFLGDQQTAAVVRGKISKNKLVKAS